MFVLKKVAGDLLSPLSIVVLALAIALALLWFSRRERLGKLIATAAFLFLVALGYGWLGGPALRSLEREYAPLASPPAEIRWIVVLGGGSSSDPDLPPTSRLLEPTLARAVEGVRLHRRLPQAKLVLSGGSVFGAGSDAQTMGALALELGVPREAVVLEGESLDTEMQAAAIRRMLNGERCILVTSALHMRRALALFRKAGVDALPAPTHFLSQSNAGLTVDAFFPLPQGIGVADAVVHEYLGFAWGRLTGRL